MGAGEHPDRGEHARPGGDEDRPDPQGVGERTGVQRARPAERDEGALPRVHPPGDRHGAQRLLHGRVDDREHPRRGGRGGSHPERLERRGGGTQVQSTEPGEGGVGGDAPGHEVGVGHRGPPPTPAVAGGPGVGPGALRADHQRAAGVHPGDRPTAGADGVEVEGRQADGQARDLTLGRGRRRPVEDQAHVGAGAAHVEAERGREPVRAGDGRRGPGPAGGARQQQQRRRGCRGVDRDEPTRRGHHRHLGRQRRQRAQVPAAHRSEVGVDHGGDGALVLAELGGDLVRHAHVVARGPQRLGHDPLVPRRQVGVQQAHRHGLHARGHRGHGTDRRDLGARGVEAATHLQTVLARHEGRRPVRPRVVERRAVLAGDLDDVGEALGRDQRHGGPPALEQRVGGHRRPVGQFGGRPTELLDPGGHGVGGVRRRREHLGGTAVGGHQVGEGAPGVGPDAHRPNAIRLTAGGPPPIGWGSSGTQHDARTRGGLNTTLCGLLSRTRPGTRRATKERAWPGFDGGARRSSPMPTTST